MFVVANNENFFIVGKKTEWDANEFSLLSRFHWQLTYVFKHITKNDKSLKFVFV